MAREAWTWSRRRREECVPAPRPGRTHWFHRVECSVWQGTPFAAEFPRQEVERFSKSWFAVWVEMEFPEARSLLILHGFQGLCCCHSFMASPTGSSVHPRPPHPGGLRVRAAAPRPILVPLCTEVPLCRTP